MNKKTTTLLLVGSLWFTTTQAGIVVTDNADQTLSSGGTIEIDFDGGGAEFTFEDMGFNSPEPGVFLQTQNHHLMTVSAGEWDVILGINGGTMIDASGTWEDQGDAYIDPFWGTTPFPNGTDVYIGAEFPIGSNTHYGWIKVNWDGTNFVVKSWAYEDTPGQGIEAGDEGTSGGGSVGVEESTSITFTSYPNPVIDIIHLETQSKTLLSLLTLDGKELFSYPIEGKCSLDLSELPKGVYLVQLGEGENTTTQKVVKE